MSDPWEQDRIVTALRALAGRVEMADLEDDEAETVYAILLPQLRRASGCDAHAFHEAARQVVAERRAPTLTVRGRALALRPPPRPACYA
jgi:hypothetical protein